jgi:hypothetical protein
MTRTVVSILLASALTAPAMVAAQWPSVHRTPGNNAAVPTAAAVTNLSAGPGTTSAPALLSSAVRPIIAGGRVYGVAMDNAGTPFNPVDDVLNLRAFDETDFSPVWTSPNLSVGNSVSFGSASAPTYDGTTTPPRLYYGSGNAVQALNAETGALLWSTPLDGTNTSPTSAYGIINASPTLGAGRVYIQTYYDSFGAPSQLSQTVALSATGTVEWFAVTGGRGTASPLFVSATPDDLVIVNTIDGLAALNAATGASVWTNTGAVPGGPWTIADSIWVEPTLDGNFLYAATYNFGGTGGNIIKVNALTGQLIWKNDVATNITADMPPLLTGTPQRLYLVGGPFGDADLLILNPATGAQVDKLDLGYGFFRNYPAGTSDGFYLAASGLRLFNLAGATVDTFTSTSYSGPVSLDSLGRPVVVHNGALVRFEGATSVTDWGLLD